MDSPWGHIERWRASTLATGTMGALAQVAAIVRNDAAELEQKTIVFDAKKHAVLNTVNRLLKFMSRVDALTSRVEALEAKHKADEAAKREFEEEPLILPPDISEYQASTPPSETGDTTPLPGGELHAVAPKEEPSLEGDEVGDLPKELEEPPDPVPEPGHIPAGARYDEMMSHIDLWATLATMVGLKAPPTGEMMDNNGKPIYFDSIDNSAYILGKAEHSARDTWIYIDGESFYGMRVDVGGDPKEPWVRVAWKYLYTAKDSWLGATADLGAIGAMYNLTMDPYEKYDMTFNGAASTRVLSSSPGKYAGQDNAWALALLYQPLVEFDKSIVKYPNIRRAPGGASNDLVPNLKDPANPVPYADPSKHPQVVGGGG